MEMTKISVINFSQKTVENFEMSGNDIKEIKCEFHDNIFKITIMNNDDVIEEVFEEDVIEEPVVEEPVVAEQQIKKLTIADVKDIIYENIPKKILLRRILGV